MRQRGVAMFDFLGLEIGNHLGKFRVLAAQLYQLFGIMKVDFGLDPSAFTPGKDRLVEAMLRWTVGEVSRHKLLLGLSARSVQQVNGEFTSVSDEQALAGLGDVKIEAQTTEADTVEPGTEIRAQLDGFKAQSG